MTALEQMCAALSPLAGGGGRVLAALDGPCASGKTTLAGQAARQLGCPLVHMDDFFLPPARKTPARLAQPGGNVDWERVRDQVLVPMSRGEPARFSPYCCHTGAYGPPVSLSPAPLVLVEGSTPSTPPCGTSTASGSFWRPPGRCGAPAFWTGAGRSCWPASRGSGSRWRTGISRPAGSGTAASWC